MLVAAWHRRRRRRLLERQSGSSEVVTPVRRHQELSPGLDEEAVGLHGALRLLRPSSHLRQLQGRRPGDDRRDPRRCRQLGRPILQEQLPETSGREKHSRPS